MRCRDVIEPGMRIIDIGCGPGAIHGYLEETYDEDVLGIDMRRWKHDYVDVVGDFSNPEVRRANGIRPESVDVIVSASAFEHNTVSQHRRLVRACFESLKPNGRLIATFAASWLRVRYFALSHQWNLPRRVIESLYGEPFDKRSFVSVWRRWRRHREIPKAFKARYGNFRWSDPPFISAGADIVKPQTPSVSQDGQPNEKTRVVPKGVARHGRRHSTSAVREDGGE